MGFITQRTETRFEWIHFEFANFRVHAAVVGCIKLRFAVCSFGCAAGALLALSRCCSAACHAHALLYASRSPPAARVLILNSRISECTRGGGVYQCRRSSSSSKQNQVHQQLMQLKSPATATAALATPPARARAHFEFANIFANFKVYKVHAACCYPDGGCTR